MKPSTIFVIVVVFLDRGLFRLTQYSSDQEHFSYMRGSLLSYNEQLNITSEYNTAHTHKHRYGSESLRMNWASHRKLYFSWFQIMYTHLQSTFTLCHMMQPTHHYYSDMTV